MISFGADTNDSNDTNEINDTNDIRKREQVNQEQGRKKQMTPFTKMRTKLEETVESIVPVSRKQIRTTNWSFYFCITWVLLLQ